MPSAGTKPSLKAVAEAKLPVSENTATRTAIPDTPPRKRNMLKMPEALPISVVATAPIAAFCAAGIAIETPEPAMINGRTSLA